ncbi:sulfate ABC transporter substrate-binding protein [Schlesneria paludicola]|uniref:sulfate ABC transporter substrate-binding protein n=1 Tax=Schlesneria paludicola TaxID=360056 RepID=UPI00029A1196|nr:sulfate ABC transporter substrate-binding protein [Schlesneria paludicola]
MKRVNRRVWGVSLIVIAAFGCGSGADLTPDRPGYQPKVVEGDAGKSAPPSGGGPIQLTNVSYDPTRELWKDLNQAFIPKFEKDTGNALTIEQSHGGSASQARAIIDGLQADVATLSIWTDTDALRKQGLLREKWEDALPNRSLPYTSTVVFVVRTPNPKGIKDWSDLVKDGVKVITPNPQTSGNGRLSLLAAWGSVVLNGGTEEQAVEFITKMYKNAPNLDTGARGATITFAQKGLGDVHITMESEAHFEVSESKGKLQLVYPSLSIIHEPHVAIVDKVVDQKGTRAAAEAYLKFLYTPEGQEIIAKHFYRPTDPAVLAKVADKFPEIKLFPLSDIVPNWDAAQAKFFADGGVFDSIYTSRK